MNTSTLETLNEHPYIAELIALDLENPDRYEFHRNVKPLLLKMGADKQFLMDIVKRNLDDKAYINQEWSMYNIPYFHVHETNNFILKIHLFPTMQNWQAGVAAHAIHHHNNYLLTTNAFFGSGYESLLFDKNVDTDSATLKTRMKIDKHFHQRDLNPSLVDSWEPHIVFIPESLSATILIWTPDKKHTTDALRNVGLLKAIKNPLRKIIQVLGLSSAFGIAKGKTYQYYPSPTGTGFMAIEEEEYFAPTKAAKGIEANNYCMQLLFSFIQKAGLADKEYLSGFINRADTPEYYKKWVQMILNDEIIPEPYHRDEINIPQKRYNISDIYKSAGQNLSATDE